jgi:hypothetical protein
VRPSTEIEPTTLSHVTFIAPATRKISPMSRPPIEQLSNAKLVMLFKDLVCQVIGIACVRSVKR